LSRLSSASAAWLWVAVALALALRLEGLGRSELWLDELHALANSAGRRSSLEGMRSDVVVESTAGATCLLPETDVVSVFRGMRDDTHPPVYFEALYLWRRQFGDGRASLRFLSVLASLATLLGTSLLLRDLGERRAATWAALLMAASAVAIQMAQDTRPYAVGALLATLAAWALVRLCRASGGAPRAWLAWAALYGACVYLTAMTHYFATLALAGPLLCAGRLGPRPRLAQVSALAAASLFAATWSASLAMQMRSITGQTWVVDTLPGAWRHALLRLAAAPLTLLFAMPAELPIAVLGLALGGALLWRVVRERSTATLFFTAWAAVPILGLGLVDLVTSRHLLALSRYPSFAVPGLAGAVGLALAALPVAALRGVLAAAALACAATLRLPTPKPSDLPLASTTSAAFARPGDVVVLAGPRFWSRTVYPVLAYRVDQALAPRPCAAPAPVRYVLMTRPPGPGLREALGGFARLFVVTNARAPRTVVPNPRPDVYGVKLGRAFLQGVGNIEGYGRPES
jgi:4-amino-4-deoxy-L-arabinose transferase-like glycosyltransferase